MNAKHAASGITSLIISLLIYLHQHLQGYPWIWQQLTNGSIHHEHFILFFFILGITLIIYSTTQKM